LLETYVDQLAADDHPPDFRSGDSAFNVADELLEVLD
jgi:hypothetical protein